MVCQAVSMVGGRVVHSGRSPDFSGFFRGQFGVWIGKSGLSGLFYSQNCPTSGVDSGQEKRLTLDTPDISDSF